MDKVSILTASRVEPSVLPLSHAAILANLSPAVRSAIRLQSLLLAVSLQVLFRGYIAAATTLWASRFVAGHAAWASGSLIKNAWKSKQVVAVRDKVFFEFATFVLGSGNGLFVMLFWPGWWVLGAASWGLWTVCG